MKRSDFLKRLGIGLGTVVVAPQVLAGMPAKEEKIFPKITTAGELDPGVFEPKRIPTHVKVSTEFINEYRSVTREGKTFVFKEIKGLSDNGPIDLNYKRGWVIK